MEQDDVDCLNICCRGQEPDDDSEPEPDSADKDCNFSYSVKFS